MAVQLRRRWLPAAVSLVVVLLAPWGARGHVGNRLRLGYRPDPSLAAAARLAEVYLEAVSAWTVDLKEYPDAGALQRAVRGEEVDLAVEYPDREWARAACLPGAETDPLLAGHFRERWGAVRVAGLPPGPGGPCLAPSFLVAPAIESDLAYYGMPGYLRRLASGLTREDIEGLLREDPAGKGRPAAERVLARRRMI